MKEGAMSLIIAGIGEVLWDLLPDGKQAGGATANFCYHIQMLKAQSILISSVGHDSDGRDLIGFLQSRGFQCDFIHIDTDHPTGTVTVKLENGNPHYDITQNVAWDHIPFIRSTAEKIGKADAICIGTLSQRNLQSRKSIIRYIKSVSDSTIIMTDLNLRHPYYTASIITHTLEFSDVLKLNESELGYLKKIYTLPDSNINALKQLMKRFNLYASALTLGEMGSILIKGNDVSIHHGNTTNVVDTVGAGDAFSAAFIYGLLNNNSLDVINETANRIASHVCTQKGGIPHNNCEYV